MPASSNGRGVLEVARLPLLASGAFDTAQAGGASGPGKFYLLETTFDREDYTAAGRRRDLTPGRPEV